MNKFLLMCAFAAVALPASATIRITEWMYSGADGEFIEFTNVGMSDIDMTGWSFDDSSRLAGTVDLSMFGLVRAGQSVILAESAAATFATAWGLTGVSIIGDNAANLGRGDEINIYDQSAMLVDRLTYDDVASLGPRTQEFSGNIPLADLGTNNANAALLSASGDSFGSWLGAGGSVANPGLYTPVPEPATMTALALGAAALIRRRRRS
jgi:predicted extracellular nuclease